VGSSWISSVPSFYGYAAYKEARFLWIEQLPKNHQEGSTKEANIGKLAGGLQAIMDNAS
jgi:hypothetical protein